MGRVTLVGLAVGLLFVLAGCGGSTTYTVSATKSCLTERGVQIGGKKLGFVAETATGGAFVSQLSDNWVSIAFGETLTDGKQLQLAYQRFAFPNVRSDLSQVLQRYRNAVTVWHLPPSQNDLSLVVGCLR